MIISKVLKDLLQRRGDAPPGGADDAPDDRATVLNVGGGADIPIPKHYDSRRQRVLDIDPQCRPDVLCDARELETFDAGLFDAVHCSHNLEHYHRHDGARVLRGFVHVLKPGGFAEIRVPDLHIVMRRMLEAGLDVDDTLYVSPAGPISVLDVIYGLGRQIESSGNDFFAHKTGFTAKSLLAALRQAGFAEIYMGHNEAGFEIRALAFKGKPTDRQRALLGL